MSDNNDLAAIPRAEILEDAAGSFGAVLAGIHVNGPVQARLLRAILSQAADVSPSYSQQRVLGGWAADLDTALHRAADERWPGWESVHAIPALQGIAKTQSESSS